MSLGLKVRVAVLMTALLNLAITIVADDTRGMDYAMQRAKALISLVDHSVHGAGIGHTRVRIENFPAERFNILDRTDFCLDGIIALVATIAIIPRFLARKAGA